MARMVRRNSYRGSRRNRRSSRRARWVVVVGTGQVNPGTFQPIDLLTPIQPASTVADLIYQQMTKPTLIAILGHMRIAAATGLTIPGINPALTSPFAWGIYRDVDFASTGTALPAYSAGYSNSWMMHHTGDVSSAALASSDAVNQSYSVGQGNNEFQIMRWRLNQRKYKRTLDSFNDTLVLSIENAGSGSFASVISYDFYFRMLLLE